MKLPKAQLAARLESKSPQSVRIGAGKISPRLSRSTAMTESNAT